MKTVYLAAMCAADSTAGSKDFLAVTEVTVVVADNEWMFP